MRVDKQTKGTNSLLRRWKAGRKMTVTFQIQIDPLDKTKFSKAKLLMMYKCFMIFADTIQTYAKQFTRAAMFVDDKAFTSYPLTKAEIKKQNG